METKTEIMSPISRNWDGDESPNVVVAKSWRMSRQRRTNGEMAIPKYVTEKLN